MINRDRKEERNGANEPETNTQKGKNWIEPPAGTERCSRGLKNTQISFSVRESSERVILKYSVYRL